MEPQSSLFGVRRGGLDMDPGCVVMDAWGKTEEARQAMKAVGAGDDGGGASGIAELWKEGETLLEDFRTEGENIADDETKFGGRRIVV
ncbi:NAD(P)-binding protein [Penicillium desertorum]|uniref:NAD(P)-binding protein n=1 Tax=Penicillium desertorum TaxID=1303715 RepID=A0A9X0BHR8_9EURO|nr:NAD(P)-binding protein [Penicillium desertorum]